jgi:hypothetical protein
VIERTLRTTPADATRWWIRFATRRVSLDFELLSRLTAFLRANQTPIASRFVWTAHIAAV